MHTIRQTNGLAGFTKRSESEHDCFGTGHSSTTISTGLGLLLDVVRISGGGWKNEPEEVAGTENECNRSEEVLKSFGLDPTRFFRNIKGVKDVLTSVYKSITK
ncbi:uncharacterized protein [Rutidosis leptorrhynchoides]|uniref:uncharacterized protein isoform X2 n=1 Tax=Rutidosis leptorrhynchoides TaxID=125765 RepID=UPI003A991E37